MHEPLTPEEEAEFRQYHLHVMGHAPGVGGPVPCGSCRLLATIDAARIPQPATDTRLREAARHVLRWYDETSALGMAEPLSISALRAALEEADRG